MSFPTTTVLFLLLASVAPPTAASVRTDEAAETRVNVHAEEVVRILRTLRDPDHPPVDTLLPAFTASAREVPELLHTMLVDGVVADAGEGAQLLSVFQRDLIIAAFGELGPRFTHRALGTLLVDPDGFGQRRAAVQVLGAIGHPGDLPRVVEFACEDSGGLLAHEAELAFRTAVTSILTRDVRGFARLPQLWRTIPEEIRGALLSGVGDTRDARGLGFLTEVLTWRGPEATQAMAQVRKLGPARDTRVNHELAFHMRLYLSPDEPAAAAACLALAAVEDLESIPLLIDMLDCENTGLRQNAHWALRSLTHLSFPSDMERWTIWYDREMDWARRQKAKDFRRLLSRDGAVVAKTLRDLSRHPFAREELVSAVRPIASHRSSAAREQLCRTVAKVACRAAIPELVDLLEDPSDPVAEAAWEALRDLTGEDLPRDPRAWWAQLGD